MKLTVKVVTDREGSEILTTEGGVTILTRNDDGFMELVEEIGEATPRAILRFNVLESGGKVGVIKYIYDDSKAYVMNDSGKTVACI